MVIVGAGGLGSEVLTILMENGFQDEIVFYDENPNLKFAFNKIPVTNTLSGVAAIFANGDKRFITAIGPPRLREKLTKKMETQGGELSSAISHRTFIFYYQKPYDGVIIQPGVGISYGVEIGIGSAIHVNATIGHCVQMGKYVNIGPNASVIGPCSIGDYSYISAKSCVLPNVVIGKQVIVTAGKVVDRDLKDFEVF